MFQNTNKAIVAQQEETMGRIAAYYRSKYPGKIEQQEVAQQEVKLTPQEIQADNEAYATGAYRAHQKANADLLAKVGAVMAARPK